MQRVDHWLFAAEDARRLASVRIGLSGLLALRLATTDYRLVAGQPAALFQPRSYMRLLDRMPSAGVTTILQVCGIAAALVAAAGLAMRASLALSLVCSLGLDGMLNSTGRVIVGDAVLMLCLLMLLACGTASGDAWTAHARLRRARARFSGDPPPELPHRLRATSASRRYGWPIRGAMATIALSLFFAGFQKLRYSGLAWVTSDNLRWILYASSDRSHRPNHLALFVAGRPWLAHVCAAGSLLLETCFPVVLFVPRLRWWFVVGVVAMHEAIRLAIGIDYSTQALTVLIVFIDWPSAIAWLRRSVRSQPADGSAAAMSGPRVADQ